MESQRTDRVRHLLVCARLHHVAKLVGMGIEEGGHGA
jgi:hypothetical protein